MSISRRAFGATLAGLATANQKALGWSVATDRVNETLRTGIRKRGIPAAVGMAATPNQILYQGAFGKRDDSGVPVTIDSIFGIMSMTKAITSVAAMQLVEQGRLSLEDPAEKYLPQLANLKVLEGFDSAGKAKLRPAKLPVTIKHLLTHTSGFCYDVWDGDMFRYNSQLDPKAPRETVTPLMFEPGTRWQYGTSVDWVGRVVEALSGMNLEEYFQAKILRPLGMRDTSYLLPASKFDRLVAHYQRVGRAWKQDARMQPGTPKQFIGGGGLYSTVGDYTRFMQMILGKGSAANKVQILRPETVAMMAVNQIGELTAGKMKSYRPGGSSDVDMQPGATEKWGLGFLINTTPYEGGRSSGSLAWAGSFNTFYWIDLKRSLCAVLMMQFLPFVDREAIGLLQDFERAIYQIR